MGLEEGEGPRNLQQPLQQSAALSMSFQGTFALKGRRSEPPAVVGLRVGVDSRFSIPRTPTKSNQKPGPTLDMCVWALPASGHSLVLECSGIIAKGQGES